MKLDASMTIPNEAERKAVMAYVRQVANNGYREDGNTITLSYVKGDEDDNGRWWGIIHFVESYAIHSIETH